MTVVPIFIITTIIFEVRSLISFEICFLEAQYVGHKIPYNKFKFTALFPESVKVPLNYIYIIIMYVHYVRSNIICGRFIYRFIYRLIYEGLWWRKEFEK